MTHHLKGRNKSTFETTTRSNGRRQIVVVVVVGDNEMVKRRWRVMEVADKTEKRDVM